MPTSLADDPSVLIPAETYQERSQLVTDAEHEANQALRNQKKAFLESMLSWAVLLALACYTESTVAVLSSAAWLCFVGLYYMPEAEKAARRANEVLRIRVAHLSVEDAEIYLHGLSDSSRAYQLIQYRKGLDSCPM